VNLKPVTLGLGIVTLFAFAFLVPIVPFTTTVYTGLAASEPLPSFPCFNPYNHPVVDPAIVYQGYESITHYLTGTLSGLGVVIYSKCTIQ